MYQVVVERSAEKDLKRLSAAVRARVVIALRGLAHSPRTSGSRKLAGTKQDWRIRIGEYRVIYEIADVIRVIRVHRIRHRREVIGERPRLLA
jgi:mRNA interferase RelE/StbE